MEEKEKCDSGPPDYGSTLVWSNDDDRNVGMLIEKYNGDVNEALKRFFESGGGTEYASARQLSTRFAKPLGLTEADFMQRYRRWRKGKSLSG